MKEAAALYEFRRPPAIEVNPVDFDSKMHWAGNMSFESLAWLFAAAVTLHNLEEAIWLPSSRHFGRVESVFPMKILRGQKAISRVALAGQGKSACFKSRGPMRRLVSAGEFRFAATILTVLLYACTGLAASGSSIGLYLLSGYALAMLLNAFIPHLLSTLIMRSYVPGAASALLFNVPASGALLASAIAEHRIELSTFLWAGPLVVATLTLSIPLLFLAFRAAKTQRD